MPQAMLPRRVPKDFPNSFVDDALIALHEVRDQRDDLYRFAAEFLRDVEPIYVAAQTLGLWSLCHRLADLRGKAEAVVRRVDSGEGGGQ